MKVEIILLGGVVYRVNKTGPRTTISPVYLKTTDLAVPDAPGPAHGDENYATESLND